MPLLEWEPSAECVSLNAVDLIKSQDVVCLTIDMKTSDIEKVLKTTRHSGFPIIDQNEPNETRQLRGFILRSTLCAMLQDQATDASDVERLNRFYPR